MATRESSSSVTRRTAKALAERAFTTRLYARSLKGDAPTSLQCDPVDPAPGDPEFANALFQGRYVFGGEHRSALNEPPWLIEDASEAWQADINGFEWLADFRATGAETARLRARELVRTWIDLNDKWRPLSWRSDVLGRRLMWWACHAKFLCDGAEPTFLRHFFTSFAAQARHLARAKGLLSDEVWALPALVGRVVAEAALSGATKRFTSDLNALKDLIIRNLPTDGTLPSRNAGQALAALRLLLAVKSTLDGLKLETPDALADAIKRIPLGIKAFRHGDGRLGVFNGGSEGDRANIDAILAASKARGAVPSILPDAGFHRIVAGKSLVLFDVGQPGLALHPSHAGLLSFELSVGHDRVIVNCGANGGPQWQQVGRSTAAHSTLTVADTNALEISGRSVRQGQEVTVRASRREDSGNVLIEASHDGYARRYGLRHDRAIYMSADGDQIRGEDSLIAINETGQQVRHFAIRFHLHPQVNASLATDGMTALLRLPRGTGMRFRSSSNVSLEESVYLGTSDGVRSTRQLIIYGNTDPAGHTTLKWGITLYSR